MIPPFNIAKYMTEVAAIYDMATTVNVWDHCSGDDEDDEDFDEDDEDDEDDGDDEDVEDDGDDGDVIDHERGTMIAEKSGTDY